MKELAGDRRPNVVLIISDDTPFRSIGYKEGRTLTPAIDSIRAQGVDFTDFYASSALCTPSRYSVLTGQFAGRCPAPGFLGRTPANEPSCITWNTNVLRRQATLGSVFRDAGYFTGYVGKWHNGIEPDTFPGRPYQPDDDPADPGVASRLREDYRVLCEHIGACGFDYVDGVNYANPDNRTIRSMQVHNHEWIAKKALDFLDDAAGKEQPFLLSLATTAIHGPSHIDELAADPRIVEYGICEEDLGGVLPPRHTVVERLEKAGIELTHQSAGAMVLDDVVAVVLARLEKIGASENTIVFYVADHGWDTAKGTCCEAGLKVPATMRWPGAVATGSTCGLTVRHVDLLPTLADMCDVPVPDDLAMDGESRKSQILSGAGGGAARDEYSEIGYVRALRHGRWKYIAFRYPASVLEEMRSGRMPMAPNMLGKCDGFQHRVISRYGCYWQQDRLHDLRSDPGEQVNLAESEPVILEEMRSRLQSILAGFPRPFDLAPQPFLDSGEFAELAARTSRNNDIVTHQYYLKGAF